MSSDISLTDDIDLYIQISLFGILKCLSVNDRETEKLECDNAVPRP